MTTIRHDRYQLLLKGTHVSILETLSGPLPPTSWVGSSQCACLRASGTRRSPRKAPHGLLSTAALGCAVRLLPAPPRPSSPNTTCNQHARPRTSALSSRRFTCWGHCLAPCLALPGASAQHALPSYTQKLL